jgi:hypothetical protein
MKTMRTIAFVISCAALLGPTACSDLECMENEKKIGKTCFPLPEVLVLRTYKRGS